jgi:hypothetical protein
MRTTTRVVIHQPLFIGWIGLYDLIDQADVYVAYDVVQVSRQSWQTRNRVRSRDGEVWLTVPLRLDDHIERGQAIADTPVLVDERWIRKLKTTIEQCYARAPFRSEYLPSLLQMLAGAPRTLGAFNLAMIRYVAAHLGLRAEMIQASQRFDRSALSALDRDGKLYSILAQLGCTHYLNGRAGMALYRFEDFVARGIQLEFQNYEHPVYAQCYPDFLPYLSALDLLLNHGRRSLDVIRAGRRPAIVS